MLNEIRKASSEQIRSLFYCSPNLFDSKINDPLIIYLPHDCGRSSHADGEILFVMST